MIVILSIVTTRQFQCLSFRSTSIGSYEVLKQCGKGKEIPKRIRVGVAMI